MAETLGSLCDKLTIVQLKTWHTVDKAILDSLQTQALNLQNEIDDFITDALNGHIAINKLTFSSNKVYNRKKNPIDEVIGDIGTVFSKLCEVNCELWHKQEKVYNIERVPNDQKDELIKQLAVLNLIRNKCIDRIDSQFSKAIK